jgi:hypothetical protein
MMAEIKIPNKTLFKLKTAIKMHPHITVSVHDIIDAYRIKTNSPNVSDERLFRTCLSSLPNDHLVNKFAIKMRDFDISLGTHKLCIKKVTDKQMEKWREYKSLAPHYKDFKPYEEVSALDIKTFVEFCQTHNITPEQLWQFLLDNTYSKSEEIMYTFYPTILPIPYSYTDLQAYNSHCLLFTQAKTGKSETCNRLYNDANIEDISIPTLLGTVTKETTRKGMLDGQGVCFVDEINKLSNFRSADSESSKLLDYMNNYLEKGIERRGVWGKILEVKGTKTCIFSGNVNVIEANERDFFHLMMCICKFGNDADKFGRRFAFFVYSNNLNYVEDKYDTKLQKHSIEIINAFRKEIINNKIIMGKALKILEEGLGWCNQKDIEHEEKLNKLNKCINSTAIKSFVKGMGTKSYKKLKFMALKITLTKNIFEIINSKKDYDFFNQHKEEIKCEYSRIKEILCYRQIRNLNTERDKKISEHMEEIIQLLKEKNLNPEEEIPNNIIKDIALRTKIPANTIPSSLQSYITNPKPKDKEEETKDGL